VIPQAEAEQVIAQQHDDWQRYLAARAEARGAREQGDE
jgi:hypothetical protein